MLLKYIFSALLLSASLVVAADPIEHISALTGGQKGLPVTLKDGETISTKASFKPPVEITVIAKTDSNDIRLGFAADQIIFNWSDNKNELRVDGGPANGKHKIGAGNVPTNKYVTIKWVVLPTQQSIYVDDQLRFTDVADYSKIDRPLSIFCHASKVSVKSIKIKQLSSTP
jgi:hypothetical protein